MNARKPARIVGVVVFILAVLGGPLSVHGVAASHTATAIPRGTVAGWVSFRAQADGTTASVRIVYWDDDRGRYLQQQQTVTVAPTLTCGLALPAVGPYILSGSCYSFRNIPKSSIQKSRPFMILVDYTSSISCRVTINDSYAWYNPTSFKWEGIVRYNGVIGGSGRNSHTCR